MAKPVPFKPPRPPGQRTWWWLTFLFLAGGSAALYYIKHNHWEDDMRYIYSGVLLITILGTGLSLIIATSNLWFRR